MVKIAPTRDPEPLPYASKDSVAALKSARRRWLLAMVLCDLIVLAAWATTPRRTHSHPSQDVYKLFAVAAAGTGVLMSLRARKLFTCKKPECPFMVGLVYYCHSFWVGYCLLSFVVVDVVRIARS